MRASARFSLPILCLFSDAVLGVQPPALHQQHAAAVDASSDIVPDVDSQPPVVVDAAQNVTSSDEPYEPPQPEEQEQPQEQQLIPSQDTSEESVVVDPDLLDAAAATPLNSPPSASAEQSSGAPHSAESESDSLSEPLVREASNLLSPSSASSSVGAEDERVQVNERLSSDSLVKVSGQGKGIVAVTYRKAVNEFLMQTRGPDWMDLPADQRPLMSCNENLSLKGRGCGLLVPTCTNTALPAETPKWSCTMVIWQSCSCASPAASWSWLKWLPSPYACYGDKTYLLDLDWEPASAEDAAELVRDVPGLMIPTGHCGRSSFFVLVMVLLAAAVLSVCWAVCRAWRRRHVASAAPADTQLSMEHGESSMKLVTATSATSSGVLDTVRMRRKTLVAVDG